MLGIDGEGRTCGRRCASGSPGAEGAGEDHGEADPERTWGHRQKLTQLPPSKLAMHPTGNSTVSIVLESSEFSEMKMTKNETIAWFVNQAQ